VDFEMPGHFTSFRKPSAANKLFRCFQNDKIKWEYIQNRGCESFQLTFEEIQEIAGIPIDHSFLKYKKELADYGWQVGKISMKEQTVSFHKVDERSKDKNG
jgi:hypothetical protein